MRPFTPPRFPVFQRQHPLAKGLRAAYLPGVTRGVNLVNRSTNLMTLDPSNSVFPFVPYGEEGPSHFCDGANRGMFGAAESDLYGAQAFTIYVRVLWQNGSDNNPLLGISYNSTETAPYGIFSLQEGNGGITALGNSNGTSYRAPFASGIAPTSGKVYGFCATGRAGGGIEIYFNGKHEVQNDTKWALNHTSGSGPQLSMGTSLNALTKFDNCRHFLGYIWTRKLSDAEVRMLESDPYALITPQHRRIGKAIAAAGGGSKLIGGSLTGSKLIRGRLVG